MRLTNKKSLVTGGAGGIGRAIALAFAREGAAVAIADVNLPGAQQTASEIRAAGVEALAIECDVSRGDQVDRAVARTVEQFERLDILVNNAAVMDRAPLLETTEETFDRVVGVNFKGSFLCTVAAGRAMARTGGGVILMVTSVESEQGIITSGVPYTASKGGQKLLIPSAAVHLAEHGIRVVGLGPGMVPSGLNEGRPRGDMRKLLAGRPGRPEEMAAAAVFLVSDEASYVNGTTLYVDGGWLASL
jgi:NAD(P)-dependent dehydrogenase (short-subunit alcohol dehydrogenase family)